ncbi:MAG: hypothetical protein GEU92_03600 [Alphaproteobacteria bacterium]|nr:hypothetical protein [Alphaproteobacteria bacterium]
MSETSGTLVRPTQLFPLTRHLSYCLTPLLARTALTPNQITAMSMAAGLGGAWCFTKGLWWWSVAGGLLLVLCYTLDNCDGEIARLKKMSSEWGAHFDDLVDWAVDSAFFAALGYGTWAATGNVIWFWLGLAATFGATADYVVDLVFHARARRDPERETREEETAAERRPETWIDWLIYTFHKLSRADFCIIVLALALFDIAWLLLPAAAVGAQVYWLIDLYKHMRGRPP